MDMMQNAQQSIATGMVTIATSTVAMATSSTMAAILERKMAYPQPWRAGGNSIVNACKVTERWVVPR